MCYGKTLNNLLTSGKPKSSSMFASLRAQDGDKGM